MIGMIDASAAAQASRKSATSMIEAARPER